jgi:phage terminase large subunit-like protein
MKRKTAAELLKSGNRAAAKKRRAEEALEGSGEPVRPQGLAPATRKSWRKLVKEYASVLLKSDGDLLLELVNARAEQYTGAVSRRESARKRVAEIEAVLADRKPVAKVEQVPAQECEQESCTISLSDFLEATARQRATFAQRLVPGQTIMLDDNGATVDWPDGDATTRARDYAQRVVQGGIAACDLNRRACARFLNDLEHGHERGLFYDPLAARQIIEWFSVFMYRPPFDWQCFVLVNLFGFRLPSGLRRFKECWSWISRQNGKSATAAGIGLFCLIADGEDCSQVFSAATTAEQAGIIFKDAKRAVKKHPDLNDAIHTYRPSLNHEESDSVFQPLASEVSSLDGLRPSALLCDEIHEWADREQWSKLTSGQVSRAHPLTVAISTAGGVQSGFGWDKYVMTKNILHGVFTQADDIFCCVWELEPLDDYRDSALWIKANPSLGEEKGLKMESLSRQFRETEQDPSSLSSFLRYQCGRWTEFKRNTSTFSFAKIDACRGYEEDFPDETPHELLTWFLDSNAGCRSYGGFDYGEVSDLACFCMLYPQVKFEEETGAVALIAEFWTPSATVQQHQKEWQVPLEQWIKDGWVRTCDGDMNSTAQLSKDVHDIIDAKQQNGSPLYNVRSIGYDKFHSRPFMSKFNEETSIECVEVNQASSLTPLSVAFKTAVLTGKLWHLGNPVIRWMLSNVIMERCGKYDTIIADKPSKNAKIDVIQAAICAWDRMEALAPSARMPRMQLWTDDFTGGVKLDSASSLLVPLTPQAKKGV